MALLVRRSSIESSQTDPWSRKLAASHVSLGNACLYAFSEFPADHAEGPAVIAKALENYGIATEILPKLVDRALGKPARQDKPAATWSKK